MSTPLDPLPGIIDFGAIAFLSGASGIGKTALSASMAVAFRDQTPLLGYHPNPVECVAYMGVDRLWEKGSKHWFDLAGFPDIRHYSVVDDRTVHPNRLRRKDFTASLFVDILKKWQLPPYSLLYVDPFALFVGDIMSYHAVGASLIEIVRAVQDAQLAVVGNMHAVKLKADKKEHYVRAQDRMGGTGALSGYSNTAFALTAPEESGKSFYMLAMNPHNRPAATYALDRDVYPGNGLFFLDRARRINPDGTTWIDTHTSAATVLTDTQRSVLLQFPPESPVSTAQFLALYSDGGAVGRRQLSRVLRDLEQLGYLLQVRKGLWQRTEKPPL